MSKYKILIADSCFPDQELERKLFAAADADLVLARGSDESSLLSAGADCDGMILDYASVTKSLVEQLPKCRVISRAGIGLNAIDLEAAGQHGIMVANIPDYCLDEVADHTMALWLACARQIIPYNAMAHEQSWSKLNPMPVYRNRGRTFAIYGFGGIGRCVAKRAQSFGFHVCVYKEHADAALFAEYGVEGVDSLTELARRADVFSIHTPLTEKTEGIIDAKLLSEMKSTTILINTSRGAIMQEDDLVNALKNKTILAAGLDVLAEEPPDLKAEIFGLPNVVITPHIAFYSAEAELEVRRRAVEEVLRVLNGGEPQSFVNRAYYKKKPEHNE